MPPETKSAIQTLAECASKAVEVLTGNSRANVAGQLQFYIPLALAQEKQLREALKHLAMLVLQNGTYEHDDETRQATDTAIELTKGL